MVITQDQEEIKIFLDELEESLNYLDDAIMALEENPSDRENIEEIFRVAHTIKGSAGFLDLKNLVGLGHAMESVFLEFLNGNMAVSKDVIDTLLECKDAIKAIGKALGNNQNTESIKTEDLINKVNQFLQAANKKNGKSSDLVKKVSDDKSTVDDKLTDNIEVIPGTILVRLWISPNEMAPSIRAFLIQKRLSDIVEIVKQEPSEDALETEDFTTQYDREIRFWVQADVSKDEIKKAVSVDLIEKVEIHEEDEDESKEISKEKLKTEPTNEEKKQTAAKSKTDEIESSDSVRIPVTRLDVLLNLVGELVIANSGFVQIQDDIKNIIELSHLNRRVRDKTRELFRISGDIQELIMKSRLVPVGQLFNRFKRFVRDYSSKTNKNIKLVLSGEETEIDKKIIDEMIKPLTHIVRNSVDHGIETSDTRASMGKPAVGTLNLEASQEGNYINIIVKDDGKGIDIEKVINKAVTKGIITKEEGDNLSEEEALNLIFHPGFSTKDEVTDISGRGIGMDVVKRSVESLNGSIQIDSFIDAGTTMTIKLPLTLAILNALIVKVGVEKFCIPMSTIIETQKIDSKNFITIEGNEMVRLRDTIIPIVRLADIFDVSPDPNFVLNEEKSVIIVEYNESLVGLYVDEFLNRQEMVIKSLAEHFKQIDGVSGASILGDGNIILILDVHGIMKLFKGYKEKIVELRKQQKIDSERLKDDISKLKLFSKQQSFLKQSHIKEDDETDLIEESSYETEESTQKPKIKLYTKRQEEKPTTDQVETPEEVPVSEKSAFNDKEILETEPATLDDFDNEDEEIEEADYSDLPEEIRSRLELAEEMQNVNSIKKLHKLFEPENVNMLKQWLLQGNTRAIQGLQQLTGNSEIKVGQSRARRLSSDKTEILLKKLEESSQGMISFLLPILPLDGAIHFILTHNNASKIIKHMLKTLSLPDQEHFDLEPLMEVTNILGAAYTNSLTTVTEVMVEPGVPEILKGTVKIKEMIEGKVASGHFSLLYIENQFLWDEEDILAELLIMLPEIKVLQDNAV
ncbi:MAG: chemotaxis protein CheW [Spirochaetia bacterium]|nr:chemotaxis protein CheW [Spirochaetia bacterium]